MARVKGHSTVYGTHSCIAGQSSTHPRQTRGQTRMARQTNAAEWAISLDKASEKREGVQSDRVCGVNWIFIIPVPDSRPRIRHAEM